MRFKSGIGTALQSRLAPFILSNPDQQTDVQPRFIRVLTVPDYFAEYRDKGDGLAAFLGTSIVAKVCASLYFLCRRSQPLLPRLPSMTLWARTLFPRRTTQVKDRMQS